MRYGTETARELPAPVIAGILKISVPGCPTSGEKQRSSSVRRAAHAGWPSPASPDETSLSPSQHRGVGSSRSRSAGAGWDHKYRLGHSRHVSSAGQGQKSRAQRPRVMSTLSAELPPSLPPALRITSYVKLKPLLPMGFPKAHIPTSMEQVWAVGRARRRRKTLNQYFPF